MKNKLNLKDLENQLDKSLKSESKKSLKKWLGEKRNASKKINLDEQNKCNQFNYIICPSRPS